MAAAVEIIGIYAQRLNVCHVKERVFRTCGDRTAAFACNITFCDDIKNAQLGCIVVIVAYIREKSSFCRNRN